MVLATIIRLEMAYPGVGILAGDSLQYLSVVTAHAVIMVFFMIMPLLFGAFGNFLLPTQLGVHDVAFPRLNSVAFWFLPGGLIMLCQLVCLDRRYQRMNCFNIREIQTLLKARFYADLLNENSLHIFLSRTTLGLKFKLQDLNFLNINSLLINRYLVNSNLNTRFQTYTTNQNKVFDNPTTFYVSNTNNLHIKQSFYINALELINNIELSKLFSPLWFSPKTCLPKFQSGFIVEQSNMFYNFRMSYTLNLFIVTNLVKDLVNINSNGNYLYAFFNTIQGFFTNLTSGILWFHFFQNFI